MCFAVEPRVVSLHPAVGADQREQTRRGKLSAAARDGDGSKWCGSKWCGSKWCVNIWGLLIRRVPPAWPNFVDDAESAERHGHWYSRGEAASTVGQHDTVTVCHLSADPHLSANAREYEHAGNSLAAAGLASCENIRASLELLAGARWFSWVLRPDMV